MPDSIDKRIDAVEDFCMAFWDAAWLDTLGPNGIKSIYHYDMSLTFSLEEAEEFIEFLKGSFDRLDYQLYLDWTGGFAKVKFKGHISVKTPEALQLCRLSLCQ
jgi:hypothetical protein